MPGVLGHDDGGEDHRSVIAVGDGQVPAIDLVVVGLPMGWIGVGRVAGLEGAQAPAPWKSAPARASGPAPCARSAGFAGC